MTPSEAQQIAGLRAADPSGTIVLRPGDVPALVLPGGREIVNADPDGSYDVWTAGGRYPLKFGLDLEGARAFIRKHARGEAAS